MIFARSGVREKKVTPSQTIPRLTIRQETEIAAKVANCEAVLRLVSWKVMYLFAK